MLLLLVMMGGFGRKSGRLMFHLKFESLRGVFVEGYFLLGGIFLIGLPVLLQGLVDVRVCLSLTCMPLKIA